MTRRYRIVATFDQYDVSWEQEHAAELSELDVEIAQGVPLTTAEFIQVAQGADGIMIDAREPITDALLDQLPSVKAIGRHSVGLDGIDLDAATRHNVVVTHYPMYCTAEVADHAIAMIYALNRRIARFDRDLRDGLWVRERYFMDKLLSGGRSRALRTQTLGVIGFGRIGREVARRMQASVGGVIATDPYVDPATAADLGVRLVDKNTLFAEADIITIHSPLTPETRGMIGRKAIARMKPGVLLVNTARGPIVNLADLNDALESGHVAGAALDVFDPEPYPLESTLAAQPNLIMTPHAAYYSEESVEIRRRETLVAVLDVLAGHEPVVVANPAVLPKLALTPRCP